MTLALLTFAAQFAAAAPDRGQQLGSETVDATFTAAAAEYAVPVELLYALGWEASHLSPDAVSAWGGYGMFDLRENDEIGGPSLERAAALISVNPNVVRDDWRLATYAVAALLAEQASEINGGRLPPISELDAWRGAVAAFSGRDEPNLQELFVGGVYSVLANGIYAETRVGRVAFQPVVIEQHPCGAPPPASTDSSLAYQWYGACADNYSNYSRGSGDIDMVVIHTVQGSYSGCYYWFANCSAGASAQYVVRSTDGQITQMVAEADVAWHAGNWDVNERSVGIEHEGYVDDCGYYTEALYRSSAALTADIAARQGVSLDRSHIIGHDEVPDPYNAGQYGGSGHHTDPGDCWDWDYYMSILGGGSGEVTGEILGYVRENDIYNSGGNLVGATVWIAETGDSTSVGSDGLYEFTGIPYGSYTIHASIAGYGEGTCASGLAASQDWCSTALFVDSGGGDTDTETELDTDEPVDTGTDGGEGPDEDGTFAEAPDEPGAPGAATPFRIVETGCNVGPGGGGIAGLLSGILALVSRTRGLGGDASAGQRVSRSVARDSSRKALRARVGHPDKSGG